MTSGELSRRPHPEFFLVNDGFVLSVVSTSTSLPELGTADRYGLRSPIGIVKQLYRKFVYA